MPSAKSGASSSTAAPGYWPTSGWTADKGRLGRIVLALSIAEVIFIVANYLSAF
jgi:hypothetical protein